MDDDEDNQDGIIVHPDDPVPWFPGQEEDLPGESDHLYKPARLKRRRRCGQCGPCQIRSNCGECSNCVRRSVLKQSCIYRKCIYLRKPVSGVGKTPPRRSKSHGTSSKDRHDLSSSYDEELDSSYELTSPADGMDISGYHMGSLPNEGTEILIEDYCPSPSIIINAMEEEPSDVQPSSPTPNCSQRVSELEKGMSQSDYSRVVKTPPHPMDYEDENDFTIVNPKKCNALKATNGKKSSLNKMSHVNEVDMNMSAPSSIATSNDEITLPVVVTSDSVRPYPVNIVRITQSPNSDNIVHEQSSKPPTFNHTPNLQHKDSLTVNPATSQDADLNQNFSVVLQRLAQIESQNLPNTCLERPGEVRTGTVPENERFEEQSVKDVSGTQQSGKTPVHNPNDTVIRPSEVSFDSSQDVHKSGNGNHTDHSTKQSLSISSTYDDSFRQFFSPPNVTVTDRGGFTSKSNERDNQFVNKKTRTGQSQEGVRNYPGVSQGSSSSIPLRDPIRAPYQHPPWYPNIPYVYPYHGIPRGVYPPPPPFPIPPSFDAMGYMVHPHNPFIRFEGYPQPHTAMHPGLVPPGFYPRYPREQQPYNTTGSEQLFSRHPDFRKNSKTVSTFNPVDMTAETEEIDLYKKHSVFRLRANSTDRLKSPLNTDNSSSTVPQRSGVVSEELSKAADVVPSNSTSASTSSMQAKQPSYQSYHSSETTLPPSNNKTLRSLLNCTNIQVLHDERSQISKDLQNEMNQLTGHKSCNMIAMDDLRMQSINRADGGSNAGSDTSSPNSSSSESPHLTDSDSKANSSQPVLIEGKVVIKQDLGDEGIVSLEFYSSKVELVQCVLDDELLKLSDNPKELKAFIEKSQGKDRNQSTEEHSSEASLIELPNQDKSLGLVIQSVTSLSEPNNPSVSCSSLQSPSGLPVIQNVTSLAENSDCINPVIDMPLQAQTNVETTQKSIGLPNEESWKESYMKMVSDNRKSMILPAVMNSVSHLSELCQSSENPGDLCGNAPNLDGVQKPLHNLFEISKDSNVTHKSSDKTLDSKSSHSKAASDSFELGCRVQKSVKRSIDSNSEVVSQKRPRTDKFVNQNNSSVSPCKTTKIVNSLSQFVNNTIDTYSKDNVKDNVKSSSKYPVSDTNLLCEEYINTDHDDQNNQISEKTIADLKTKYFSEFPDNFKITSQTDSYYSDSLKNSVENVDDSTTESAVIEISGENASSDVESRASGVGESDSVTVTELCSEEMTTQKLSCLTSEYNVCNQNGNSDDLIQESSEIQSNIVDNDSSNSSIMSHSNSSINQFSGGVCSQSSLIPVLVNNTA